MTVPTVLFVSGVDEDGFNHGVLMAHNRQGLGYGHADTEIIHGRYGGSFDELAQLRTGGPVHWVRLGLMC